MPGGGIGETGEAIYAALDRQIELARRDRKAFVVIFLPPLLLIIGTIIGGETALILFAVMTGMLVILMFLANEVRYNDLIAIRAAIEASRAGSATHDAADE